MKEVYRYFIEFIKILKDRIQVEDVNYLTTFLIWDEIYKRFGVDMEIFDSAVQKYVKDLELVQLYNDACNAVHLITN